jgi:pSer/pThr/pTyr-binding forkhead associated (FHA) protein
VFEEEIPVEKKSSVKSSSSLIKLVGWLVSYDIDPAGIDYRLYEGKTKIGRGNHCNIIVNDSTVSEEHALLLYKDEKFILQDELSANGTFVNGNQIEERVLLEDGDEITLGHVNFIIKII